ncbi:MAG: hypothetical protein BroJett001_11150 [Chloroflexota bacterium]|jgi:hypothetical protein|nr:MAG: hypothetical protein QY324_05660 [Anaerolineales bacterium]GIK09049.1 MAG: hypothetical protein BroJett001_11150 [Chloroflexota bacterium]
MMPIKPDLVILPFKATLPNISLPLTLEQTLSLLRSGVHVQIERSQPGAPDAIGWTIFRRTPRKYLYENEPLFRFERGARRYIRKAYAIHYSLLGDDGMTHSHLHL